MASEAIRTKTTHSADDWAACWRHKCQAEAWLRDAVKIAYQRRTACQT